MKENLGWPLEPEFFVPDEVYTHTAEVGKKGAEAEEAWNKMFAEYCEKYPDLAAQWKEYFE
ncbi:MAG: hypothetical protein IJ829_05185, partial [Kiritimatiellae bacterium]|nr:hypothetical protein [Kiritimatiellia bacterium]